MYFYLQALIFQQPLSSPFISNVGERHRWYSAQKVRNFSATALGVIETLWADVSSALDVQGLIYPNICSKGNRRH
jgi:hypothetical protein